MTLVARCEDSQEGLTVLESDAVLRAGDPGRRTKVFASMEDVLADATGSAGGQSAPNQQQQIVRLWGPVTEEEATACGAPVGAASVLLLVPVCPDVLTRFRALIPDHVKSQPKDTVEILKQRLGSSSWLDVIHFKYKGHGRNGRTSKVNETAMPQARRVTWSVRLCAPYYLEGVLVEVSLTHATTLLQDDVLPAITPSRSCCFAEAVCLPPVWEEGPRPTLQANAL